jgi:hypothetical protein
VVDKAALGLGFRLALWLGLQVPFPPSALSFINHAIVDGSVLTSISNQQKGNDTKKELFFPASSPPPSARF